MKLIRTLAVVTLFTMAASSGHAIDPAPSAEQIRAADAALEKFTSSELTRFSSEAEFKAYAVAVRAAAKAHGSYWVNRVSQQPMLAFSQATPDPTAPVECPEDQPDCLNNSSDSIVVTGTSVTPRNPSITNNQMRGVDEGDIVKQIDDFLLILQDGRIFVVNMAAGGGRRLALADRANVYRDTNADTWYDEMLVFGDRILITGYSYGQDATELSVFRLGRDGKLTREGVFTITSNDYYSTSNYATRLVGDNLVIYTPFNLTYMARNADDWPVVRRWRKADASDGEGVATPLFDATSIFKPVRTELDPAVHTVSVCPLGRAAEERNLQCRTTAFVGSEAVEWYVTADNAYLWTGSPSQFDRWPSRDCGENEQFRPEDINPALIYRIDLAHGSPSMIASRGEPIDQFSMHFVGGNFHALLKQEQHICREDWGAPARLSFLSLADSRFSTNLSDAGEDSYVALPGVGTRWIVNRFTDKYLVYGSLSRYRRGLPKLNLSKYDAKERKEMRARLAMPPVRAVPIERPHEVVAIDVGHTVIRAEQLGNDMVVTGYRDRSGLHVTRLSLKNSPRIGSAVKLEGRFESEGRSHAFNSLLESDGHGLMGLPTVGQSWDSGRYWWRSSASDVSFIRMSRGGLLAPLGELERKMEYSDDYDDEDGVPGYDCEVSCIDWYGNSRPIFTDGRIFGLAGAELIEGRVVRDGIVEVQRLNIAVASTRLAQLSAR